LFGWASVFRATPTLRLNGAMLGSMVCGPYARIGMTPTRDDMNKLVYDYRLSSGQPKRFQFWQIMHWRGLSSNGIIGYSPIRMAAESIGPLRLGNMVRAFLAMTVGPVEC